MEVSGDFGDLTIYTNRFGKKVAFPKSPPDKAPTPIQNQQRSRFFLAQADWSSQTKQVKSNLEELCRKANIPMTGQNLWIHAALMNDNQAIVTLERQTGISVPKPNWIP